MSSDLNKRFTKIVENQILLQRTHGFPIDSINPSDKNRMAEIYTFKAIGEIVELQRTQPSELIPMSKSQPTIDRPVMIKEAVDVILFMINWGIARNITLDEFLDALDEVQDNNVRKAHEKIAVMEASN